MSFTLEVKQELIGLKIWNQNSQFSQEEQIKRICVREAFIETGSISDPNKEYHLEIVFRNNEKAEKINYILKELNINSKIIKRNKKYVLYIKDGEEISKFLALIGANDSVIKFEEIRVIKDMKNKVNRKVNYETANINKTINAAIQQIEDIKLIKAKNEFAKLPEGLKELANLRIENPDVSITELGKMLSKPLSKSGVNHRLLKLKEIAENLKLKDL